MSDFPATHGAEVQQLSCLVHIRIVGRALAAAALVAVLATS